MQYTSHHASKTLLNFAPLLFGLLQLSMLQSTLDSTLMRAGYLPDRPTISRRFMPEEGTPEYYKLVANPDNAFLKTITAQLQTLLGVSLIEILSRHPSDEVSLGQRNDPHWICDVEPLEAFDKFGRKLGEIEKRIMAMNCDEKLKNRVGPLKMPYNLLYPASKGGLTGMGIPNNVSI